MIVKEYLNEKGSYKYLCYKHRIPDTKVLRQWVSAYNTYGQDGLMRRQKRENYTFDFKRYVVELYLTTEVSYQDLALQVGVNNPSLLCRWVNDYRIAGPDALKPKMKGRPPKMKKSKEPKKVKDSGHNIDDNYLKRLEEENLKLRIENAYLKELRRLRLEGKPQKKKRE
jgi:transposase